MTSIAEKDELISIIMPAYNAGKYIKESIESVLNQTYQNWELIIIDDGSTDTTSKVVQPFLINDTRIQYYRQENGKQGKARNAGIKKSKGNLIAFLDADDVWMPAKLQTQIGVLKQNDADLVFTDVFVIDDKGDVIMESCSVENRTYYGEEGLSFFFRINQVPILTVLAKKEAILAVGCFKEIDEIQNIEDYDLWLRMLYNGYRFVLMNEVLGAYRIHDTQTVKGKLSVMKILKMLHEMKIEKKELEREKQKAIKLWMMRCLKYDITKAEFRSIISFYPHFGVRKFFKMLFFIIPHDVLNKIIRYSCKGQYFKNAFTYISQKTKLSL